MMKYIKEKKGLVVVSLVISFCQVIISLWQPNLTSKIIKNLNTIDAAGNVSIDQHAVFNAGILVISVGIIGLLLGIINTFIAAKISTFVGTHLRSDIFKKIQKFSYQQIEKFSVSHLIVRLTNDVTQVQNLIMAMFQLVLRIPLMFIGCIIFTIMSVPKYWWTTFLYIFIVVIVMIITIRSLMPKFKINQIATENLNTIVKQNVDGARVVKSFVQEDKEEDDFKKEVDGYSKNFKKIGMSLGLLIPFVTLVANLIILYVLFNLSSVGIKDPNSLANIVSFSQYIMILMFTVVNGGFMMNQLGRAMVSVRRIDEILDVKEDNPYQTKTIKEIKNMSFNNVDFTYASSSKPTLQDISFEINKGEKVGIIGPTGSGKSTLVQLIAQLFYPTKGSIKINGDDQFVYNHDELLKHIAIVLQKANLFSGDIESNLYNANQEATEVDLVWASDIAQASEFISKKPDGFKSEVYQKGANFSGGQKQRLSIARGLMKKPDILILDDSTSALDAQSEKLVKDAIYSDLKDMGVVIVAQKISSIIETDKIIVLNEGSIEAVGTHQDLIEMSKTYQEIYLTQKEEDND